MRSVFRLTILSLTISLLTASNLYAQDNNSLVKPVVRGAQSDESVYFIMTDRFENGDSSNDFGGQEKAKAISGFAPEDSGYWHGGDFKGITSHLSYIKSMGFTSIWITPPVVQRYVQGSSAGYHGYWGLDFTTVDPHLGTESDFKELVNQAHKLNLKVIIDVVVNHTADVISYVNGLPQVSPAESGIKKPDWLNSLDNYHNLGDNPLKGNPVLDGDFFGLDDLKTENPTVVNGWIEIWSSWITKFDIDGMRIDTFKHVNPEFWKAFIPKIQAVARNAGKRDFPIYGEVADSDAPSLSAYVAGGQVPSVLDFNFQNQMKSFVQFGVSAEAVAELFNQDDLYTTSTTSAYGLATFLGNHDMGRIGYFLSNAVAVGESQTLLERAKLSNAALFLLRGGPVLYYGDEKGMTGSGGDKRAREDMFATQVIDWQNELRIGSDPIKSSSSFEVHNPLEDQITDLQKVIAANPALRTGTQEVRFAKNGLFIASRFLNGDEYIVALNGSDVPAESKFNVAAKNANWKVLAGNCSITGDSQISLAISQRNYCVAKAENGKFLTTSLKISTPIVANTSLPSGWKEISVQASGDNYTQITFSVRVKGGKWITLGTADRRTFATDQTKGGRYRVYLHPEDFKKGSAIEIVAAALDGKNNLQLSKIVKFKI
jgi:alpha-amylase